jgi:hypothetical protein
MRKSYRGLREKPFKNLSDVEYFYLSTLIKGVYFYAQV